MGKASFDGPAGQSYAPADEVIYQIYPRTFKDANGDGHGDIQGIIQQLDYIKSLGVDAVWISPMYKSPEGAAGDGGYAVDDHRALDPKFGTLDDFRELLAEAHSRDLKIYMDFVLPHTSNQHAWFEASRDRAHPDHEEYKNFYVWQPGHYNINGQCMDADEARERAAAGEFALPSERPGMPNNWKSVFGGPAWTWDDKREAYYLHHFFPSQPSVNLNDRDVRLAIYDDMDFWKRMGIDGFRLDSVPYSNYDPKFRDERWMRGYYPYDGMGWQDQYFLHSMCQDSTKNLISEMRGRFKYMKLMGEVIAGRKGGAESMELADGYVEAGLDCCYTTYERAIGTSNPQYMRGMLEHFTTKFPTGGLMFTVSDHDGFKASPRAYTRITNNLPDEHKEAAYRQALMLYMTLPGTLSIYQGDELGLPHAEIGTEIPLDKIQDHIAYTKGMDFCRDGARTAFPHDKSQKNAGFSESDTPTQVVPESHVAKAVSEQTNNTNSTLNFVRQAVQWRKDQPAMKNGVMKVLKTDGDTLAFTREGNGQTLLCVFNLGKEKFYFTPSDVLDAAELSKIGLSKGDVLVMHPYGAEFAGEHEEPVEQQPAIGSWINTAEERHLVHA